MENETDEQRKRRLARERQRRWTQQNPERARANQAAYREKNREKRRRAGRSRMAQYRTEQPEKVKAWNDAYRKAHPDRVNAAERKRYAKNPERRKEQITKYRAANPEKHKGMIRKWAKENPERRAEIERKSRQRPEARAKHCARQNARDKRIKQATPAWANMKKIERFYIFAAILTDKLGVPWEVDHKVPLISDRVCGLHVENNLMLLPASENRSKGNRRWEGMW